MNSSELNKAVAIAEKARYQMGVMEFVNAFIDEWAYFQTGLYPPAKPIPEELKPYAFELSHCLLSLMKKHVGYDVLGAFLSACSFEKRGFNFFPTPTEVSKLMSAIIGGTNNMGKRYYEPCSGTGSIAMNWLLERRESLGPEFLSECELYLEDVDLVMCKASMIQIVNLLQNANITVNKISIVCIDSLSRKPRDVAYYLSAPEAIAA